MKTEGTFGIVQLTRLGDLIQTHQAVSDLKVQQPDIKVKLIARTEFAKPLLFLLEKSFDEIILIDKNDLLHNAQDNLKSYLKGISEWVNQDSLQNIDVLINLSFCETSNYLSSLIKSKHRLGTYIDETNQTRVNDQWSQLVYSMVMGGPNCPFHLVDIFKNILGLKVRQNWNTDERHIGRPNTIALHPFASQDKKYWKPQKWSEVIFKLLKESEEINIKIFGSNKEVELGKEILSNPSLKRYRSRIEFLVGKLTLVEVYAKLQECSHFIGHDSALGHLAKEANLASLTISMGTVRPIETTPYGNNSFVLSPKTKCFPCFPKTECNFYQCHADLSYQAVTEVIRGFVTEDDINYEQLKKKVSPFHLDSLSIHRYGPTNTGWYAAENIGDLTATSTEAIRDIFKVALTYKMEEIEENLSLPKISEKTKARLIHINSGIEQMFQLCEFGKKYSKDVLVEISKDNPSIDRIKTLGDKVQEVDQLMDLLNNAYPELQPIVDFYKVIKSNLHGDNVVEISESSYLVYNDNSVLCSLLYELINNTVGGQEGRANKKQITKEGSA
ncbi:MAG: glycosyltransferase family 9 protein [Bacteriovoracaceae bacterium]|nr:glycosyltransferase family 9 protein [Bacteriovoracaceae bacterium]